MAFFLRRRDTRRQEVQQGKEREKEEVGLEKDEANILD
jgi:hypothetical protein